MHALTILLLAGAAVGFWLLSQRLQQETGTAPPRPLTTRRWLTHRKATKVIYRHVDGTLGVRAVLTDQRAKRHDRVAFWLSPRIAATLAPRQWAGVPLPSFRKMCRYVREVHDIRPWRDGHLVPHRIVLHYTSETAVNDPRFLEMLLKGRRRNAGLAQALGIPWHEELFTVEFDWPNALLIITLNEFVPEPVPTSEAAVPDVPTSMPDFTRPAYFSGNGQPLDPRRRLDAVTDEEGDEVPS